MQQQKWLYIFFLFLFGVTNAVVVANNNDGKDTLNAIVVSSGNPIYCNISKLSGNEIVQLIDSILELDVIPKEILTELNAYAESRLLKNEATNTLTYFYDNSPIPAHSVYQKWDENNIFPYDDQLTKEDTTLLLTLTDSNYNCNYYPPIINPVITSNFGWRSGRTHAGIDLDLEVWDPVYAVFDGMVRVAIKHPGYGRVVIIRHYNGLETLYAHLHRFKVKTGDIIEAGQVIGLGGSSGRSTGSHLHFEMRYKGKALNPKSVISFKENNLISHQIELIKQKYDYIALPTGVEYHTIERGDFMYKIANQYGLTVNQLCELNGIKRNKTLIVGRKLRIK
ncbi:MAG: peptidoglycan DD-metalloendopeptidase family protein [Vicingaceae bacterium]|nr:peptidoglycan DD-metalloendopeptidase family protein [Vicingaceae bacterium]